MFTRYLRVFLAPALLLIAVAPRASAQFLSCKTFLSLEKQQRYLYVTGFIEGLSYNELELRELVKAQEKAADLKDEQRLALSVMSRVAVKIGEEIPAGLTIE